MRTLRGVVAEQLENFWKGQIFAGRVATGTAVDLGVLLMRVIAWLCTNRHRLRLVLEGTAWANRCCICKLTLLKSQRQIFIIRNLARDLAVMTKEELKNLENCESRTR